MVEAADGETCESCPQDCGPCPGQGQGDCCTPTLDMAGCENPDIEDCVCTSADPDAPYCCNTAWDTACVDLVTILGCGSCIAEK